MLQVENVHRNNKPLKSSVSKKISKNTRSFGENGSPGMAENINGLVSNLPILPPCRICGEKASGFHYGANTCEACKVSNSNYFEYLANFF